MIFLILSIILILVARERGLKNHFEAMVFAIILFILLMGVLRKLQKQEHRHDSCGKEKE